MFSRPNPKETEEDILRLQEEYFQKKASKDFVPTVQLISNAPPKQPTQADQPGSSGLKGFASLVGNIVERQSCNTTTSVLTYPSKGFPEVKKRDLHKVGEKNRSIFSQQQSKKLKPNIKIDPEASSSSSVSISSTSALNIPQKSYVISGKDALEIHEQNVQILKNMSEHEILEERNKLIASTDPALLQFLKLRKEKQAPTPMECDEKINEEKSSWDKCEVFAIPEDIASDPNKEKWLHFDSVEPEKLEWMEEIKASIKLKPNEPYEARFDFDGWLLPYKTESVTEKNRSLFHHGQEPDRPGYTLQELFQLCRSSVNQQKVLALNTIANILSLQSCGVYDGIIDIPIEQIFFVIRFAADENTPAVLAVALKALRNMFFYKIDELCLDSMFAFGFGTVQPTLGMHVDFQDKEEKTINDQELAEMDLVRCLARTDIAIRIRYVINVVQPEKETIKYCLELLTRLLRDSHSVMVKMYGCEDLFSSIIKHFVPKIYQLNHSIENAYNIPQVPALKLLRVLAGRSRHITEELINKHNLLDCLMSYIANDIAQNIEGINIQIETFHLLEVIFHYGLAKEFFYSAQPHFLRSTEYHIHNTNVEPYSHSKQLHFASLIGVLNQFVKCDVNAVIPFLPFLVQGSAKWMSQCSSLSNSGWGRLQVITSTLNCLASIASVKTLNTDDFQTHLIRFIRSEGFSTITESITNCSNLTSKCETHKTRAAFKCVEASVWETPDHVVPCLFKSSCMPFVNVFTNFLQYFSTEVVIEFLNHSNTIKYLKNLHEYEIFNLAANWFTRIESQLVFNILRLAKKSSTHLRNVEIYYSIAIKAIYTMHSDQNECIQYLLENIIFSKEIYPEHVLVKNIELEQNPASTLSSLQDICATYREVLMIDKKKSNFTSHISIDVETGNLLPVDWVFTPIVFLYSQDNANKRSHPDVEAKTLKIVKNTLRWISFFESNFHSMASLINPTDQFCRLSCVFLCSNTAFLDAEVRSLLEKCLRLLLSNYDRNLLNFDKEIQGLTHFQDFYTQLLEQYQGVSYGDAVFANYILVPLAQKHNVKWRKALWSEYAGVLEILMLKESEVYCTLDEFLQPEEKDESLVKCYMRCLSTGMLRRSPFLGKIAMYHARAWAASKKTDQ